MLAESFVNNNWFKKWAYSVDERGGMIVAEALVNEDETEGRLLAVEVLPATDEEEARELTLLLEADG